MGDTRSSLNRALSDYILDSGATLIEAVAKMNKNGARAVVVVEEDKVTGLISEGDVMRALLRGVGTYALAREALNRSFRFLESEDYEAAFELFKHHGFGLVPIVDDSFGLAGVLTLDQILQMATLPGIP